MILRKTNMRIIAKPNQKAITNRKVNCTDNPGNLTAVYAAHNMTKITCFPIVDITAILLKSTYLDSTDALIFDLLKR